MGGNVAKTAIAWTDFSFNTHWGCVEVSEGCRACYARTFAHRLGLDIWGVDKPRRFFGDKHWNDPLRWNRAAEKAGVPARVFCSSMADVFEAHPSLGPVRQRLWKLIADTPWLRWQLLTKRPENWGLFTPISWQENGWPENAWALVTAENQEMADKRIPLLLKLNAKVRGVSYEPAIGPIDFRRIASSDLTYLDALAPADGSCGLNWIICGGESGHGARAFDEQWLRSLIYQTRGTGTRVFMKQFGSRIRWRLTGGGAVNDPDSETPSESRRCGGIYAEKGDDPSEWPEYARLQEFPE